MSDEKENDEGIDSTENNDSIEVFTEENFLDRKSGTWGSVLVHGISELKESIRDVKTTILTDRREDREHDSALNKRKMIFAGGIVFVFAIMWFTAMLMGETEIAENLLIIFFGGAGGAGAAKYFSK